MRVAKTGKDYGKSSQSVFKTERFNAHASLPNSFSRDLASNNVHFSRKLLGRLPNEITSKLSKANVSAGRLVAFNESVVDFYSFDKIPLFFEIVNDKSRVLFPSVYATWLSQEAWPIIVVHRNVLSFLESGADLMLPGIICNNSLGLPQFEKDSPITVCIIEGETITGPVAVGRALMSSAQMLSCGMKGRGVQILHIDKDHLWELGDRRSPPSFSLSQVLEQLTVEEESRDGTEPSTESVQDENDQVCQEEKNETEGQMEEEKEAEDSAEDLLKRCFLAGLKFRLTKSATFPYDVGQFYARCLLPCVPAHRKLDMKKTKYKKFATFLDEMNSNEGGTIVKIQGKGKGNDVIAAVTWDHPLLKKFEVTDERIKDEEPETKKTGPSISEVLSITEPLLPLIKACASASKGQTLTPPQLREIITKYVKDQKLNDGKNVKMDPLLAQITKSNELSLDWNTLVQKIQSLATPTFVVELADKRRLTYKVKAPKIHLKVENRMGNKKVTVISNCELLGIDGKELAHRAQVGVAASASVQSANAPFTGNQIVLQGSQVPFVSTLLSRDYGIDKKFIDGFEVAKKKK